MIPAKNDPTNITTARNIRITVSSIFEPEEEKIFSQNFKNLNTTFLLLLLINAKCLAEVTSQDMVFLSVQVFSGLSTCRF